jgi:hypothetical protein
MTPVTTAGASSFVVQLSQFSCTAPAVGAFHASSSSSCTRMFAFGGSCFFLRRFFVFFFAAGAAGAPYREAK